MNDFDEWWEKGTPPKNTDQLKVECENLLNNSTYDCESMEIIEREMWYYEEEKLNLLKANLLMNQIDHISAGMNYTQSDIKNKLRYIK